MLSFSSLFRTRKTYIICRSAVFFRWVVLKSALTVALRRGGACFFVVVFLRAYSWLDFCLFCWQRDTIWYYVLKEAIAGRVKQPFEFLCIMQCLGYFLCLFAIYSIFLKGMTSGEALHVFFFFFDRFFF